MHDRTPPATTRMELRSIRGIPLIKQGDDLAAIIADSAARDGTGLLDGDIIVIAQKIVSKAEGRMVQLETITVSAPASELAARTKKDARIVELILQESSKILRERTDLVIAVHRLGFVLANAGVDQSNVDAQGAECALLLPIDPDRSAAALREVLRARYGVSVAVIINDSIGRAWRIGTVGTALGVAGLAPLNDLRGKPDLFGRTLRSTVVGHADEIAAAASLLQGQAGEGMPVVIVRGLPISEVHGRGADIIRDETEDLFR